MQQGKMYFARLDDSPMFRQQVNYSLCSLFIPEICLLKCIQVLFFFLLLFRAEENKIAMEFTVCIVSQQYFNVEFILTLSYDKFYF